MRAALVLSLALVGCSAPKGEAVDCALDGSTALTKDCRLERQGTEVVLVRPDGGFRRLGEVEGRLVTLDGAEAARYSVDAAGMVDMTLGRDRFRFRPTGVVR